MTKTTRGKAIMIETKKSQTHANMKKTHYTDYTIAKAVGVKDGIVTTYKLPNDDRKHEPAKGFQRVLVIGDDVLQAAALKLYQKAELDGPYRFFSLDEAKAAITALV
jgi:hypothetical protein